LSVRTRPKSKEKSKEKSAQQRFGPGGGAMAGPQKTGFMGLLTVIGAAWQDGVRR
jgi:hypothetical protein